MSQQDLLNDKRTSPDSLFKYKKLSQDATAWIETLPTRSPERKHILSFIHIKR